MAFIWSTITGSRWHATEPLASLIMIFQNAYARDFPIHLVANANVHYHIAEIDGLVLHSAAVDPCDNRERNQCINFAVLKFINIIISFRTRVIPGVCIILCGYIDMLRRLAYAVFYFIIHTHWIKIMIMFAFVSADVMCR